MSTVLPYKQITKIPYTEPDAIPDLWNVTYEEIDENLNRLANEEHFAACVTDAGIAAKEAQKDNFSLGEGAHVTILFKVGNTAESPTLNVSSTGAFPIVYGGNPVPASALSSGRVFEFRYSESKWHLCGSIDASASGDISVSGAITAASGTFSGNVSADDPTEDRHLANKRYVDANDVYGKGIYAAVTAFNDENGIL